jgi:hypothetical protein
MLEKDIQSRIIKKLEADNWLVIKLIQTNLNGIPDLLCLRDGKAVFIEVKRLGGKIAPLQEYRIEQLRKKGFIAFITNDYTNVINRLREEIQKIRTINNTYGRLQTTNDSVDALPDKYY